MIVYTDPLSEDGLTIVKKDPPVAPEASEDTFEESAEFQTFEDPIYENLDYRRESIQSVQSLGENIYCNPSEIKVKPVTLETAEHIYEDLPSGGEDTEDKKRKESKKIHFSQEDLDNWLIVDKGTLLKKAADSNLVYSEYNSLEELSTDGELEEQLEEHQDKSLPVLLVPTATVYNKPLPAIPVKVSDIRSRFEKLKEEPEIVKVVKPKVVEPKVEMADSPAGTIRDRLKFFETPDSTPTKGKPRRQISGNSTKSCNALLNASSARSSVMSGVSDYSDDESDDENCYTPEEEERNSSVPNSAGEEEKDEKVEAEMKQRKQEDPKVANRRKRFRIAEELYMTEDAYYNTLVLIHHEFRKRLLEGDEYILPPEEMKAIFMNTKELHSLHLDLRNKLKERLENWELRPRIGDIMKEFSPFFGLYTMYMASFENAIKTLTSCIARDERVANAVIELEADPLCKNLKISQHMLGPVQRVPRYRMLLEDYIKRLDEESPDYPDVKHALSTVAKAANKANENIAKLENFELVTQLLRNVNGIDNKKLQDSNLMIYIKHGIINKMSRRKPQPRFIFLFSDVLLICKVEGKDKYRCTKKIPISNIQAVRNSVDPNASNPFNVITKKTSFMLCAKTEKEKDEWMSALQRVIKGNISDTSSPQRIGLVAPVWIPDHGVSMCMNCERSFTPILRRHHCRACGKVFCWMCSQLKHTLSYDRDKVGRVCDNCFRLLEARSTRSGTKFRSFTLDGAMGTEEGEEQTEAADDLNTGTELVMGEIYAFLQVKSPKDKEFKKLWCVVEDHLLTMFEGAYDKKAKLSLPLLGWCIADPEETDHLDSKDVLKVGHKNLGSYFLRFESEEDKEKWYDVLIRNSNLD